MSDFNTSGGYFNWNSDSGDCAICKDSQTALSNTRLFTDDSIYKLSVNLPNVVYESTLYAAGKMCHDYVSLGYFVNDRDSCALSTMTDDRCTEEGNAYFFYDDNDGQCSCCTTDPLAASTTSYFFDLYYVNAGMVSVSTSSDECHAYEYVGGCVNGENIEKLTDKTIR